MRHQKKQVKLGRDRDTRRLLLGNLATSLILHEKMQTTAAKAKAVQPLIDEIISKAKTKDKRISIRYLNSILQSDLSARKVLEKLAPRYSERKSGFTRIIPIKFRAGDNAPLVQIELI